MIYRLSLEPVAVDDILFDDSHEEVQEHLDKAARETAYVPKEPR